MSADWYREFDAPLPQPIHPAPFVAAVWFGGQGFGRELMGKAGEGALASHSETAVRSGAESALPCCFMMPVVRVLRTASEVSFPSAARGGMRDEGFASWHCAQCVS